MSMSSLGERRPGPPRLPRARRLLLTCEHGGNHVPARYRRLFAGKRALLESHRGWDPGALAVAKRLARDLRAPLIRSTVTRLLVDLNRPDGHPTQFSEISRRLPAAERARVRRSYHAPHWRRVEHWIAARLRRGERVLHVAVHSFTPKLRGVVRRADIGLLFDPARPAERRLCDRWIRSLRARCNPGPARGARRLPPPALSILRNAPYRGTSAGLTTSLRRRYTDAQYAGIELELSQRLLRTTAGRSALSRVLLDSLRSALK